MGGKHKRVVFVFGSQLGGWTGKESNELMGLNSCEHAGRLRGQYLMSRIVLKKGQKQKCTIRKWLARLLLPKRWCFRRCSYELDWLFRLAMHFYPTLWD